MRLPPTVADLLKANTLKARQQVHRVSTAPSVWQSYVRIDDGDLRASGAE